MQIVFLIILLIMSLYSSKIGVNDKYCDMNQTNAVKGICILLVFLSHSNGYLTYGNSVLDKLYAIPFTLIGQLMVAMFLFYSGYGIAVQFQQKGNLYLQNFIYKRIVKTEIHFALGVLLFLLLNTFLGIDFPVYDTALAFIGWTNIGNSNWYIFDILLLYCITFLAFSFEKQKKHYYWIWLLVIVVYVFLYITKNIERWWYDTILAYPFGFTFAFYKKDVDKIISTNKKWSITLIIVMVCFAVFYILRYPIPQSICSIFFAALVVLITMRLFIGNRVLYWMGTRLFEIYLFQRIPMIILKKIGFTNPLLFIGISAIITAFIAEVMHRVYILLDKKMDSLVLIQSDNKDGIK